MKAHTELVLCVRCRLYKKASEFSHFYSLKQVHARECDYCHDHPFDINERSEEQQAKRLNLRKKLTPVQKNFSKSLYAKKARDRKARLEKLQAELELKKLKEDL